MSRGANQGPNRVRVTGGEWRGRLLTVPRGARPSEGRVREALFSIWRERLSGARFLDLFAGSGAAGFEALSRGAASCVWVDEDRAAVAAIELSCAQLGVAPGRGRMIRRHLPADLAELGVFDLVFADPPYEFRDDEHLLAGLASRLAPGGELVVEHSSRRELPSAAGAPERGLVLADARRYGAAGLSFYRHPEPP